jgi:peptidyl-dipeptidase A
LATEHSEVEAFIGRFTERLEPAEKTLSEAWWRLATTGSEEAREELVRAGMAYNNLFADAVEYERVKGWYEGREAFGGSALGRQVGILFRTFAGRQGDEETLRRIEELEAEANAIYGNHRGTVRGEPKSENELREVLRLSDDESLRREAWEASKSVGVEVEETVRELARLRNKLARDGGYDNHYLFSLALQEIRSDELTRIMDDLEAATHAPFRDLKTRLDGDLKARFGTEHVYPWHLSDPFFQQAPEIPGLDADRPFRGKDLEALTQETYDALGLEVRDVLAKSDLYERAGKDQHAFCLHVGRSYPYDVRVLANVRDDAYWMDTMLHEFGHAIYDKYVNPALPYLLRTVAHTNSTEAIALMMGGLADDPGWISTFAKVPEADLDTEKLAERRRAQGLVFTRWALVMYHFEKAFYENPDRAGDDLNALWWDLVERLQLVQRPPDRDAPDWAAKIHVAIAPVYYHNYVLGNLTAAQLRRHLEDEIVGGPFYESDLAGRYLQEAFFGPGARDDWKKTVLRATGEELTPAYFVEALCGS